MIYLVIYKETNDTEGYVKTKTQFKKWLSNRNKERRKQGELIEHEDEFELIKHEELQ
jgi:hypothetical protein